MTPISPSQFIHPITGHSFYPPFPEGFEQAYFGMGCFWGVERCFWQQSGVWTTAAGYAGGTVPNPSYEAVCSGQTGHAEVVLVVFDPQVVDYLSLLRLFWERHDPTQGMRQGNDVGTQYRSVVYCTTSLQLELAQRSQAQYQNILTRGGYGPITTEIASAPPFYYAELYHQQYLAKNPDGYCGLRGTGLCLPV